MRDYTQARSDAADCVMSLAEALQQCGGRVSRSILDMTLLQFITEVAAQNNIRFVYVEPDSKKNGSIAHKESYS